MLPISSGTGGEKLCLHCSIHVDAHLRGGGTGLAGLVLAGTLFMTDNKIHILSKLHPIHCFGALLCPRTLSFSSSCHSDENSYARDAIFTDRSRHHQRYHEFFIVVQAVIFYAQFTELEILGLGATSSFARKRDSTGLLKTGFCHPCTSKMNSHYLLFWIDGGI